MAEVNITSVELHSFLGTDVSVTLNGDQRDHPSIFGHVQLVTKTHVQLAPATIDSKETAAYQININDIAKCTSVQRQLGTTQRWTTNLRQAKDSLQEDTH